MGKIILLGPAKDMRDQPWVQVTKIGTGIEDNANTGMSGDVALDAEEQAELLREMILSHTIKGFVVVFARTVAQLEKEGLL